MLDVPSAIVHSALWWGLSVAKYLIVVLCPIMRTGQKVIILGLDVSINRPGEGEGSNARARMQKPPEICDQLGGRFRYSGGHKAGALPVKDYNACTI